MLWKTCLTQTSINHSKLIFLHKKRSNEQTDTLFDVAISLCLYLSRQHGCLPIPACCQYFGSNRSCPVLISSRLGMRPRFDHFDVIAWPVIQCISTCIRSRGDSTWEWRGQKIRYASAGHRGSVDPDIVVVHDLGFSQHLAQVMQGSKDYVAAGGLCCCRIDLYTHKYVHTYINTYVYINIYTYVQIYIYICTTILLQDRYLYTCNTHKYVRTYIHTYMNIYTYV